MTAVATIEDACELVTDGTHFTPAAVGIGVPFLTVKDLTDSGLDFVNCSFITNADFLAAQNGNCAPCRGDVLFSKDGTVGKVHVVTTDRPFAVLSSMAILRPDKNKLDSGYLGHVLKFPAVLNDALKRKTGSAIRRIVLADLKQVRVPLPPLPEQKRIAAILDKVVELQAKRRAALKQLNGLTQSLFFEMFGDPVTNAKGFPTSRMGDVCDVRDGTHDSPRYVSDGGYPLVTSKNLTGGIVDLSDVNFISEADYLQINKRSKVNRGDIIMPMIGTIGSPVLVSDEPRFAIKNVALIKFREASPSAVFVRELLRSPYFDRVVGQKNRGGSQKFVSLGDLRELPLPLPPQDMQREFASRVAAVDDARTVCFASEKLLAALFASLQQQAFSEGF